MNRGELETMIAQYMHRTDLGGVIPGFIDLATKRLGRILRSQVNEIHLTFTPLVNPSDLPADYRNMRAVYSQESRGPVALTAVNLNKITRYRESGSPAAYAIIGKQITIKPFRASTYEMVYFAEPAALATDTSENEILDEYPYLYLYASLVEANIYVQDPDQASSMVGILQTEVDDVNAMSAKARAGSVPQMSGA